jgi:hypothetical protein
MRLLALALLAQPPPGADGDSSGGWAAFYVLIGLVVTAVAVFMGHGYWVYRRAKGPIHSADKDIEAIVNRHAPPADEDRRYDRPA